MGRITKCCVLPLSVTLLMAADPAWKSKPISEWSAEDAKEVLANSPWAKAAQGSAVTQRSEAQLRERGRMGGGASAGKRASGMESARLGGIVVRWESALPVRTAELKAGEVGAPDWQGDYYAIAVYNVPGLSGNQKFLAGELKRTAFLKLDGKKDIRPSRVDVDLSADKLARVVYLFPRTVPITADDKRIGFVAQMGELSLAPYFITEEMQFQGKLEL